MPSVAEAGPYFKCLNTHMMPMYATLIFITEELHLVTYIQQFLTIVKVKVRGYAALAYSCYNL